MEESQDEKPNKAVDNRRPDGTFGANNLANPAGRPKGKTLKEYKADKFRLMTDEEKDKWIEDNKVSGETQWKMAEGMPKADVEHSGEVNLNLVKLNIE